MSALVICFDAGVVLSHEVSPKSSVLLSEPRTMPMEVRLREAPRGLRTCLVQPVDALEVYQNAEDPRQQNQCIS